MANSRGIGLFCLLSFFIIGLIANNAACEGQSPVSITATPSSLYALRGVANTIDVLFQIKTEAIQQERKEAEVEIAVVLDNSGSMEGQKLEHSKKAIIELYNNLETVFTNAGKNSQSITKHLSSIWEVKANGGTNMMDGIEEAYKILKANKEKETTRLQRVFVFSDGQVNAGITNMNDILSRIREINKEGISFTTFGLGFDYNEHLMKGVAEIRTGRGDYFYIAEPGQIPQLVSRAIKGLTESVGSEAILKIRGANGAVVTKIFNHPDIVAGAHLGDLKSNNLLQIISIVEYAPPKEGEEETILHWTFTYIPPNQKLPVEITGSLNQKEIMFTDNDALARDINPAVQIAKTLLQIGESDTEVLEMVKNGKMKEAKERKEQDLKKVEEMEAKDDTGMARAAKRRLERMVRSHADKTKSKEEILKEQHYDQHAFSGSMYLAATEWTENKKI